MENGYGVRGRRIAGSMASSVCRESVRAEMCSAMRDHYASGPAAGFVTLLQCVMWITYCDLKHSLVVICAAIP